MLRRVCIFSAILTTGLALRCRVSTGDSSSEVFGPECSTNATDADGNAVELADMCFYHFESEDAGCVPLAYTYHVDVTKMGCNEVACWCLTDDWK